MYDIKSIIETLTFYDIEQLMISMGSSPSICTNNKNIYTYSTICHNIRNGKHKLYYNEERRSFYCYTECKTNYNITDLIIQHFSLLNEEYTIIDAIEYIIKITGKAFFMGKKAIGFKQDYYGNSNDLIDDWDFINNYYVNYTKPIIFRKLSEGYIDYFKKIYSQSWLEDNISIQSMERFNIRYYNKDHQIIIPHRHGITGDLIGIRGRNLLKEKVDKGYKYMPVRVQKEELSHAITGNVYGLYENQKAIKIFRKVLLGEAEKLVLQCESYYGTNNFAVAACGSNVSLQQRDMLLALGVEEVIYAPDKDFYHTDLKYKDFEKHICKIARKFLPYVRFFIIDDYNDLLDLKMSPTDRGKATLEILMKQKIEVTMDMVEQILER